MADVTGNARLTLPRIMGHPPVVHALEPGETSSWKAFLDTAINATLFHDLDFLSYHPADRFRFHHLMVTQDDRITAVVPGGLVDSEDGVTWRSPLGASIGGPVVVRSRIGDLLAIVNAVLEHARAQGWVRVEVTLPPGIYHPRLGDAMVFALARCGFRECERWLCPVVDLCPAATEGFSPFEKRTAEALRAGVRRGLTAVETGVNGIEEFGRLVNATYARHGCKPTHTLDELALLLRRFPDRMHLLLVRDGVSVSAGIFLMQVTSAVGLPLYVCTAGERRRGSDAVVGLAAVIDLLRARGFRWLDMGPSASTHALNPGTLLFKEGLGAVGYSRTRWSWTVPE